MWMMTKHGFYSIVQKSDGIHVRSRERQDLDNLKKLCGVTLRAEIKETPSNDYRFRMVVERDDLYFVMSNVAEACDYSNFKAQIDSDPAQRHKPYHEVWGVLARALGAYGRKGDKK